MQVLPPDFELIGVQENRHFAREFTMFCPDAVVEGHYSLGRVMPAILAGLRAAGTELDVLSVHDLAPVDAFHTRGRDATTELIALADLRPGLNVLDVGCGIGGSARYLAAEHGCVVSGVDVTREYVETASELSRLVGLEDFVEFRHGSALELPYADDSFDVVWTEHVQMNVEGKSRFYREISRVLVSGGRLVFHDIFLGEAGTPSYPTPWAEDESLSWLAPVDAAQAAIGESLRIEDWVDKTALSLEWFRATLDRIHRDGAPPLGVHLLMGNTAPGKLRNVVRNLEEGRIVIAQGVATKA